MDESTTFKRNKKESNKWSSSLRKVFDWNEDLWVEGINQQEQAVKALVKPNKKKLGRKSVLTEDCVRKLIACFQQGFSDEDACDVAKISRDTFYRHMHSEEFSYRVVQAKSFPLIIAGTRVLDIMINGKDDVAGPMIRWYLERRMPEIWGKKKIVNNTLVYKPTYQY